MTSLSLTQPDRQELTIVETKTAVIVAYAASPDDWVARFEKTAAFPAYEWAERMVALYQQKQLNAIKEAHNEPVDDLIAEPPHVFT